MAASDIRSMIKCGHGSRCDTLTCFLFELLTREDYESVSVSLIVAWNCNTSYNSSRIVVIEIKEVQ